MKLQNKLLITLLTIFFTTVAFTQEEIKIKPLSGEIEFDGKVTEPIWKLSQDFPLAMHFPVYNNPTTEKSEIYITFDDEYLWIGAILYYDDISNVVSTSKKRDEESENSDGFGILLDTYDDNENALGFFTMPSGLKIDYTISNDGQGGGPGPGFDTKNYTWNSFWDVKTVSTSDAWHVEMRIPFSSLRFQSVNDITKMGLIINRNISHCNEIDTYPAIDTKFGSNANLRPSFGKTIVFEGIKSRNPIYISPYAIGGTSRNYELNEAGDEYVSTDDPKLTGGLDVKYNLNSNLTLDFTVNTDFAQVEADDEQVNLTRYSLFFPEKRLFFQERSGVFSFELGGPQNLFYSRNIGISHGEPVSILGGVRLVGRLGKWDVGFLNMNTTKFNGYPAENFGVARLRKQVINENSYIGGMLTSRIDFDGSYNVAYGVDGIFRISEVDYLDIKIAQTQDKNIDSDVLSLNPTFFSLGLQRRSEKGFVYEGKYAYWGKDFNPGAGFMFINNVHEVRGTLGYGWFPGEKSSIFNYFFGADFEMTSRIEDGNIENMEFSPEFRMSFKSGYTFYSALLYQKEGVVWDFHLSEDVIINAGEYSFWGFRSFLNSPRTKKIVTRLGIDGGGFYDGNRFSVEFEPEFNLSSSLQLSASYQMDKVNFSTRNQSFTNNIARIKATYMLNTELSASSFVQFNEVDNILVTNFRLRYNPRDGNDFYLVFNDIRNADKSGSSPKLPPYLSRTLLLKYTHTFRL
ncbi:MAG: carbohydrate binding family 9 domain-containing protein [Mariniphaga sp.]|nr:carbohydrate binding family 9 domain-containing protein [Mariniphaga sp.]